MRALICTARDFDRNNYLTYAAALAFFFLLSLFPLLIFLASTLALMPIPDLFEQVVELMARVAPPEAMGIVQAVLRDILRGNTGLLSIGILGAIWAASGGFAAMIGALNVAYDVREGRPYWKKRLVAIGLTILIGCMTTVALTAMVLGPRFGYWLSSHLYLSPVFAAVWPYLRWAAILAFTVLSVETMFYLAPNVRQRFLSQLPGALVTVLVWLGASYGLGWYLRNFADFNKTYGALGAAVALMLWFYLTALAVLLGAELNAELTRARGESVKEKERPQGPAPDDDLKAA
jgi:membrane protein